ncbi:hypothetical protein ASPBRDRAFT_200001 [Aspergillus brasiliensis CBS 101740]|uniref:Alcohol dehydrogenase-like N-terminal domain-containing protein n=1 Tax=Aspergillus brasiliensis (strain CBS 101740 / IMI 381727 / IBT 21946) TaxID=767769 RepID=A0A1L9U803_ASPBC|nr:hypothetical protein ASPBRDRAFT_200001 [Aspergillus brasiliensis CBS 101740]
MRALRLTKVMMAFLVLHDNSFPCEKISLSRNLATKRFWWRVHASGFCHTDYQVYQGVHNAKLPMLPSHEPAGTIAVLGPNMRSDWKVGERVGVISLPFV